MDIPSNFKVFDSTKEFLEYMGKEEVTPANLTLVGPCQDRTHNIYAVKVPLKGFINNSSTYNLTCIVPEDV